MIGLQWQQESTPRRAGHEIVTLKTRPPTTTTISYTLQQGCQTQKLTWAKQTSFNLSDGAHFWSNCYVNKQNCRIWSETNPQVYVETPLHPKKLTVGCALWAGGILLQKR
ncbi:hypothetical protein TNCV_3951111 [Trichonephila clavipes]|nr:hypothetical protein TNCV_3951111 [Trichonephila clavipes]